MKQVSSTNIKKSRSKLVFNCADKITFDQLVPDYYFRL